MHNIQLKYFKIFTFYLDFSSSSFSIKSSLTFYSWLKTTSNNNSSISLLISYFFVVQNSFYSFSIFHHYRHCFVKCWAYFEFNRSTCSVFSFVFFLINFFLDGVFFIKWFISSVIYLFIGYETQCGLSILVFCFKKCVCV